MKTFVAILWLLTLGLWGLMLLMTHGAPDVVEPVAALRLNDNADHFLAFGLLGGLLCLSLWALFPKHPTLLWLALPVLLVYAGLDEKTRTSTTPQAQVRHCLADAAGASIAVTSMYLFCGLSRLLRRPAPGDQAIALSASRAGAAPGTKDGYVPDYLGSEVEAALASYTDGDAEVGEHFIRVEKASTTSPTTTPVRARARRVE